MSGEREKVPADHEAGAAKHETSDDQASPLPAPYVPAILTSRNIGRRGNTQLRQEGIAQLQRTQGNRRARRMTQQSNAARGAEAAEPGMGALNSTNSSAIRQPEAGGLVVALQQTPDAEAAAVSLQRQSGSNAGPVAVQRDDPPAPGRDQQFQSASATPLNTIDDLITLVERVERAYPGDNWQSVATRIRKSYYTGFLWDSLINDREKHSGLDWPPLSVQDFKAFATASAHPVISVDGKSIDIGHVFTGLDATNFPKTGKIMGAASVEGPPGSTWSGDVGSALAEWDFNASSDPGKRSDYYNQYASNDDMLGDVDGIALSAIASNTGAGAIPASDTLSNRLRAFYKGTAGGAKGASQRYTKFAQGSGFHWTGRAGGIQLDAAARKHIRSQIDNFAVQWRRKKGGQLGLNWFHDRDIDWFTDRFVTWVQAGLAAENP